jgi:hypothetical protein
MSQAARLTRARQLTASVWPGPGKDGFVSPAAVRLRKLAAAGSTGLLPFADGAVYVRDGRVVHAQSSRTPGPPAGTELAGPDLARADWLAAALALTEPTVDAAAELLWGDSRPARFRSGAVPAGGLAHGLASGIAVDALLAEVARRQRVMRQLSAVVTPDTTVVRNPHLGAAEVGVSALQWALLIRVRRGTTPRDLAWAVNRSVFGTTIEVYRLLTLRLLAVPRLVAPAGAGPAHGPVSLSFIQAATERRGGSMSDHAEAGGAG